MEQLLKQFKFSPSTHNEYGAVLTNKKICVKDQINIAR